MIRCSTTAAKLVALLQRGVATMPKAQPADNQLPETYVQQVKEALEHLYDVPYLQHHALASRVGVPTVAGESAAQLVRRKLIGAIESLSPGSGVAFRAPQARMYQLLQLRYVEGLQVQECADELGLSLRQAYRDLRRGEESVAAMLAPTLQPEAIPQSTPTLQPGARELSALDAEIERLRSAPTAIDLRATLQRAYNAVERLASQRAVAVQLETSAAPLVVSVDPATSQQVFVSVLSYAVQHAAASALVVRLDGDDTHIRLTCHGLAPAFSTASLGGSVTSALAERLGWALHQAEHQIQIVVPRHDTTILVIDDNEGLAELLARFLSGYQCRVVTASSGREGLRLAEQLRPDAIVLDVMMPEMDGWEVLQSLRTRAESAHIPVIVCSVFNDPGLAHSLDVALFLAKPISREQVLAALRQTRAISAV